MNRFGMRRHHRPYRPRNGGNRRRYSLWRERGPLRIFNRSRHGVIWGVCRGVANHFNLSVGWVRFFTVAITLLTGVWPGLLVYIAAALLMKPEPVFTPESAAAMQHESGKNGGGSSIQDRKRSLEELKGRFAILDQRLRRMEDDITSRDYEWERRFNE